MRWVTEVLVENLQMAYYDKNIDLTNLVELIEEIQDKEAIKEIVDTMNNFVDEQVSYWDLCKKCFNSSWNFVTKTELIGEYWGAPAYYDTPIARVCNDCGFKEEY